jgi:hypothetical protein
MMTNIEILFDNWTGTMDPSAYISLGEAIRFHREHNWQAVCAACHQLASQTRDRINEMNSLESVCPDSTPTYAPVELML